ncbi:JmjC domain-containing protein [Amycolatopsis anabasis]|uniref:JmjC domain-containing protein n=1 Tax=Amycolatopsis anabasis TaxID=1840409 RepID=UPI00131BAEE8|nr:cupin domain-containing protein [Amycolatopsis anabasis]
MTLDRLVSSAERFRREVFGSRHVHHTADELTGGFTDLFSAAALDELLGGTAVRTASIRLAKDGRELLVAASGVPDLGDPAGSPPYVDTEFVRRGLATGHTLILRSLHRFHPPLRAFAHALAADLGHPVRVNAFISPPHAVGAALHYDTQDVFVLQIAGSKVWELKSPPIRHPLPSHAWFDFPPRRQDELRASAEPLGVLTLRPGDTLYLPGGTMHAPRTEDSVSIHLTVGVTKVSRHELLRHLVDVAGEDPWFREAVDLGALEAAEDAARELLGQATARLAHRAAEDPVDRLLWTVREAAFRESVPEPVSVLPATEPTARHRLRVGMQFSALAEDGALVLRARGRSMRLPAAAAPVLELLRKGGTLDDDTIADDLDRATMAELRQALTEFGLLVPELA